MESPELSYALHIKPLGELSYILWFRQLERETPAMQENLANLEVAITRNVITFVVWFLVNEWWQESEVSLWVTWSCRYGVCSHMECCLNLKSRNFHPFHWYILLWLRTYCINPANFCAWLIYKPLSMLSKVLMPGISIETDKESQFSWNNGQLWES